MAPNRFIHASGTRMRRRPLFYAGLLSLLLWYTTVALVLTGHTRILWGMGQLLSQAGQVAAGGYRALRWLEGDSNVPGDDATDA